MRDQFDETVDFGAAVDAAILTGEGSSLLLNVSSSVICAKMSEPHPERTDGFEGECGNLHLILIPFTPQHMFLSLPVVHT